MMRLLSTFMDIFLCYLLFKHFFKELKVSSNKYNWYRHFAYHFFLFLNPIFLYKLDALKKCHEVQYDFILWSNFYIPAVKMPIYSKPMNRYVAYFFD